MLFNSLDFVVFFPLVVAAYFLVAEKWRWVLLLAASYYFYACWKAEYLVLIVASTLIDYFAAIQIERSSRLRNKRLFLALSVTTNLGLLFAFKYFNFVSNSVVEVLQRFNLFINVPTFHALLPVGISFYTFQTLSYSIDVYRGQTRTERHLGIFALYVAFFPQLVAGPIERSSRLLPQFRATHSFDVARICSGLHLMLWGFFKKLVIADRLAIVVEQVYSSPSQYRGLQIILATYFFAYQIYCDFSGYSDIAVGVARLMGFDLMENFRRPYFATSISEFWRRWHISLSTWFRDYLYIPLGGSRIPGWRTYRNLLIVFTVSGLWHGANWTFVIWGILHGFCLVLFVRMRGVLDRFQDGINVRGKIARFGYRLVCSAVTMSVVLVGWVFFRANSLSDSICLLRNALHLDPTMQSILSLGPPFELAVGLAAILFLEAVQLAQELHVIDLPAGLGRRAVQWPFSYLLIVAILLFGVFSRQEFIYFQF